MSIAAAPSRRSWHRAAIVAVASIGCVASVWSLGWIDMALRAVSKPSVTVEAGVGDQASQAVAAERPRLPATSHKRYRTLGRPLEIFLIVYFFALLSLEFGGSKRVLPVRRRSYMLALVTVGLSGALWIAMDAGSELTLFPPGFIASMACIVVSFGVVAIADHLDLRSLALNVSADLASYVRSVLPWTTMAVGLILWTATAVKSETADTARTTDFAKWFVEQPRSSGAPRGANGFVEVVKFNDYLCPPCARAHRDIDPVIQRMAQAHPGRIRMVVKDFPLERECNSSFSRDLHVSACEAAVAVRLASEGRRGDDMAEWLWQNQARLTPTIIAAAARDQGGVADYHGQYDRAVEQIRRDVAFGKELGVTSTPTVFVNGVKLKGVRPSEVETAIQIELGDSRQ